MVDRRSGVVRAAVSFDREVMFTSETIVVVEDSGFPVLSASARLVVTIRDVDDERPQFQTQRYAFRVAENQPTSSSFSSNG